MARPHPSDGRDPSGHGPDDSDDLDWLVSPRPSWSGGLLAPYLDPLVERVPRRAIHLAVGALVMGGAWLFVLPLFRPGDVPVEQRLPLASESSGTGSSAAASSSNGSARPAGVGRIRGIEPGSSSSSTVVEASLTVQASGAVARGGVYDLPAGSRVDDLVRAAGGLAPDADADRINLAAPLVDGERVWIPRRGDLAVPEVVAGTGGGGGTGGEGSGAGASGGSTVSAPVGPVDLNTATAEQLDTLPGVGPTTAAAILAYRDEHGSFSSIDELLEVRGIGDAKLEALREAVTV